MRLHRENHKTITVAVAAQIFLGLLSSQMAWATAALDDEVVPTRPTIAAPPAVSPPDPALTDDAVEDPGSMPSSRDQSGPIAPSPQIERNQISPNAGQPTYSIRLPLGVSGSTMPKLDIGQPGPPPTGSIMPRPSTQDYSRPVGWRATAEAIRVQPASSSLIVSTIASDFKTTYSTIFREAPAAGWSLASISLPAGHFLLRIPKATETDSPDEAAAWLVILLSPIDSKSTEMRVKIQSRRTSNYALAVSNFIKRCQLKANGNELL